MHIIVCSDTLSLIAFWMSVFLIRPNRVTIISIFETQFAVTITAAYSLFIHFSLALPLRFLSLR